MKNAVLIVGLLCPVLLLYSFILPPGKVSLKMESKSLVKGKVLIVKADVFYQYDQGKMLTHYLKPMDYIFITNKLGEAKVYYPSSNEVYLKQSAEFDTEKGLLYFFLSNKLSDLGMRDMGFKITNTRYDENLTITSWLPPPTLISHYGRIELVHESYRPIYIAYYDPKGKLLKKIYYYQYTEFQDFVLPAKVVQIDYLPSRDSLVSKITYSNIATGSDANSEYFNYKIPVNAKVRK